MRKWRSKIPKVVNVLGHEYTVELVPASSLGRNTAGLTTYPARKIELDESYTGELVWLVFLHELKHAYDYECGLTQIFTPRELEKECDAFASFISSLQKQGIL